MAAIFRSVMATDEKKKSKKRALIGYAISAALGAAVTYWFTSPPAEKPPEID